MKKPTNILDSNEYIEPNTFENDQESILFYAYLEQEKYINELEQQLTLTSVGFCQFEKYAEFCIECDRKGMKPLKYKDYLEIG